MEYPKRINLTKVIKSMIKRQFLIWTRRELKHLEELSITTASKEIAGLVANNYRRRRKATAFVLAFLLCGQAFAGVTMDMAAIKQIESSGRPLAYNKASGARGLYQITAICLEDYNNYHKDKILPDQLWDEGINTTVAEWYMNKRIPQLLKHFKVEDTIENRIIAWNAGIRYAIKGQIPNETKSFIEKYRRITNAG